MFYKRKNSLRAGFWNYENNAAYFITIGIKKRPSLFGKVIDNKMQLSECGEIVANIWQLIPEQFPDTGLGEFIIMPTHMHGMLIINYDETYKTDPPQALENTMKIGGVTGLKNPMLNNSVSRIIRWFKGRSTYELHKLNKDFKWERNFYDRIIFNEIDYNIVENYIRMNPTRWKK